jgi:hypothetical protein
LPLTSSSDRSIAADFKVSPTTIGTIRKQVEAEPRLALMSSSGQFNGVVFDDSEPSLPIDGDGEAQLSNSGQLAPDHTDEADMVIAELVAPPKQKRRGRDGKLRSVPAKPAHREPTIEPVPEQPKRIAKRPPLAADDVMRRPRAMKWLAYTDYLKNRIADLKAELADLRAERERLIDFERDDPEKIASALMAMPEDRRHQLQRHIDNALGPKAEPETTRADIVDRPERAQKCHGRPAGRRNILPEVTASAHLMVLFDLAEGDTEPTPENAG